MSGLFYGVLFYALLGGLGYVYWEYSQNKIERLQEQLVAQELALKTSQDTINSLTSQSKENERARNVLTNRLVQSELEQRDLIRTLHEHDLTKLATAKPGLIENIINADTEKVFDSFESISSN